MWAGNVAQYDSAFVKMLDYYINKIESPKNNPDDYQDRFNCGGNYWIKAYEKYRTGRQFEKLIADIRSGHISCPLNNVVNTYGAQPVEAAILGMYYADELERSYNLKFTFASANDKKQLSPLINLITCLRLSMSS